MSSGQAGNQARVSRDYALLAPKFADAVRAAIAECNGASLDVKRVRS